MAVVPVPGTWTLSCSSNSQGAFGVNVTASGGGIVRTTAIVFMFVPDTTSTKVQCIPSTIIANQTDTVCLADVSRILVGSFGTSITGVYSGSVVFSYNSTQGSYFNLNCLPPSSPCFSNSASCHLDPRIGCGVSFSSSAPVGSYQLTGYYAGGDGLASSSGQFILVVTNHA